MSFFFIFPPGSSDISYSRPVRPRPETFFSCRRLWFISTCLALQNLPSSIKPSPLLTPFPPLYLLNGLFYQVFLPFFWQLFLSDLSPPLFFPSTASNAFPSRQPYLVSSCLNLPDHSVRRLMPMHLSALGTCTV